MKKGLTLVITAGLLSSVAIGCSTPTDSKKSDGEVSSNLSNLNKTGLPIVKDQVKLTATVNASSDQDWNKMRFFQEFEKQTNIKVDFTNYGPSSKEKFNLMFASNDFPDIILKGASDKQILDAAAAGEIIPLNDLIAKYAPNWQKAIDKYPYIKKMATMKDGKIYSLPFVRMDDINSGIRDQTLINVKWLSELGLKMPVTTEDYYQVLKAFKDNAGKGSIPKNAVPWYFLWNANIGGNLDIFGSFGVLVPKADFIVVNGGKVQFQAINPAIKEPIKYLNKLYKEGLIQPESFTDDWNTYLAKSRSNPPAVGVFASYFNTDSTEQIYDAMMPVKGPGVDKPLFRQQTNTVERNYFSISKNNKNPEASLRWIDSIADPDWTIQAMYGMYGDFLEKQSDDKIKQIPDKNQDELIKIAPANSLSLLMTPDLMDRMIWSGAQGQRGKNYLKYKPFVAPIENFFPPVVFTSEQTDKLTTLTTDILGYTNKTFAKWVVDGGIDEEWDAYVKKVKDMKSDEFIKVYQDALDDFNKTK
jgi:putative aldouronate transport system substrate-binding protein